MAIQWYPGHMRTAREEAVETLRATDVVIEVLAFPSAATALSSQTRPAERP